MVIFICSFLIGTVVKGDRAAQLIYDHTSSVAQRLQQRRSKRQDIFLLKQDQ